MNIRPAEESDIKVWANLRHKLWPRHSIEECEADSRRMLADSDEACFLLYHESSSLVGFIECKLYHSDTDSYTHVEGWYVEPQFRRQGWGRELIRTVEGWSLHHAIKRLTSDTNPNYPISPAAHAKAGFKELRKFTIYYKDISNNK